MILKRLAIGVLFGLLGAWVQGATITPRVGFTEPALNDSGWGTTTNNNWTIADSSMCTLGGTNAFTGTNSFSQPVQVNVGNQNVAMGLSALSSLTTGGQCAAIGWHSQLDGTSGGFNTSLGYGSLLLNTTGSNNVAVGDNAAQFMGGSNNTAVGSTALFGSQALLGTKIFGANNTAVGSLAGTGVRLSSATTTGSNNTFLGYNAGPGVMTPISNSTCIGANCQVSASNQMVLGASGQFIYDDSSGTLSLGGLGGNRVNINGSAIFGNGGVYPSTGTSHFQVMASTTETYSLVASTDTANFHIAVSTSGHFITSGSTAPVISACGTGPAIVGDDNQGTITVGSGVTTACTATFYKPWGIAPVCTFNDDSTAVTGGVSSVSQTAITFSFSATIGGGHIYYRCGCSGTRCR